MVILVLVVGEDSKDPLADHDEEGLPGQGRISEVVKSGCELFRESNRLVELANGEESSVTGKRRSGDFDLDRSRGQEIEGTACTLIVRPLVAFHVLV